MDSGSGVETPWPVAADDGENAASTGDASGIDPLLLQQVANLPQNTTRRNWNSVEASGGRECASLSQTW